MIEDMRAALARLRRLRAVTGESFSLKLDLWVHQSGKESVTWQVWDGCNHYEAPTSDAVLSIAEQVHRGKQREPLDGVQMPDELVISAEDVKR